MTQILRILLISFFLTSCVSINLGGSKRIKSEDVQFSALPENFVEFKSPDVDHIWKNKANGNMISYLSECDISPEPSLENILKGVTAEIEDSHVIEYSHVEFNSRDALHAIIDGTVDGVQTRFELLVVKKNNCIYLLTYAAVAKSFAEDQRVFNKFTKEFEIK